MIHWHCDCSKGHLNDKVRNSKFTKDMECSEVVDDDSIVSRGAGWTLGIA